MARTSPSVGRVVAVLNFFAEHPGQAFTLSQIIKSLRINPSTCFTILGGLVEGAYLYRNPDKTYVLGPAAANLADSARRNASPIDVARREMRALADEIDVVIAALFLERDELVVRERAASLTHLGALPPPGQRYPVYPWAIAFMGAHSPAEIDAWMERSPTPVQPEDRATIRQELEFLRVHGYVLAVFKADRIEPLRLGVEGIERPRGRFVSELDPDRLYYLQFVTAPVMGGDGKAAFSLALHGFTRPYSAAEVAAVGAQLREACGRVASFITGGKG